MVAINKSNNNLRLEDFDYELPKESISQTLTKPRDNCKLLVVQNSTTVFAHKKFADLVEYLRDGDVIVINNTKVSHAKLVGKKTTGAVVEALLTKKISDTLWQCRLKGGKLHVGTELVFSSCNARIMARSEDIFMIEFNKIPTQGILPTPPYIQTQIPEEDYQTMFAEAEGSLAAPTAALHFTPELVKKLEAKEVKFAQITLHIGAGTFMPVKDPNLTHTEPEFYEISRDSANIINSAKRLFAVGTTSVKTLETAWSSGKVQAGSGMSTIFIRPDYQFNVPIHAMITNFHLPKSSLLMLTCAFGGRERVIKSYNEAIAQGYHVGSLGDSMLLFSERNK
ncbi:MAG: tRNA preQ1(34) S-adenosylmethionine ribosyltransferase-isomerase QueA [Candidatus Woesearchaeota archaeon]|nr:tRNA preQ1(34) S-adenosylmethionine ribosyltransferase-isomerase QueA [Candidatus Woesearchaeota archaeon]